MTEPGIAFRSKLDAPVVVILAAAVLMAPLVLAIAAMLSMGSILLVVALVLALTEGAAVIWLLRSIGYFVTEFDLVIRCGPYRRVIHLADIASIRASRSIESALALSVDRLELRSASARLCLISPADRRGFVRAIRARVQDVEVGPDVER